jgi:hypothetical protein
MSKKTTLERAYFHINNGGLTFSIVERVDVRKDCIVFPADWQGGLMKDAERQDRLAALPREDRYNRKWFVRIETNHFGVSTSYNFPLFPVIVKWFIWSLQRVLARMEAPQEHPSDEPLHDYERTDVRVEAQDGQQTNFYWPVPRKASDGSGDKSGSSAVKG